MALLVAFAACFIINYGGWLALCVSCGRSRCVSVAGRVLLKLSATLSPSQYLFKTPQLGFRLTLSLYIGIPSVTHTHTGSHTYGASL